MKNRKRTRGDHHSIQAAQQKRNFSDPAGIIYCFIVITVLAVADNLNDDPSKKKPKTSFTVFQVWFEIYKIYITFSERTAENFHGIVPSPFS